MSQDFEFFEAGPEFQAQIFRLWCDVFTSWDEETKRIIADRLNAGSRAGTVRTPAVRLRSSGTLIAALRLEYWNFAGEFPGQIRRGVHVGEVAVRPEYQGCGVGTLLMEQAVRLLKNSVPRPDFAFLGGYTGFYRRFGFLPVDGTPRLVVPLAPERGGTKRFPVLDRLRRPDAGSIREFLPGKDGETIIKLQTPAPGETVIDADMLDREFIFRSACEELDCFVTPAQGEAEGFLFRCGSTIYNSGFRNDEAGERLLSEAFFRIAATGAEEISITGNKTVCEKWLRMNQLPFRRVSPVGGICSAMRLELDRAD